MSSVSVMMGLLRNQHQLARPTNKEALDWYKQNLKNGKVSEEATRIRRPFWRQNSRKILKVSLQVTRVFKLICSGTSWGKREDQEKIMIFLLQTSGRTTQMPDQRSCPRRRRKVPEIEILWKIRREKYGTSVVIVASVGPATLSHSATAIQLPIPHILTPRWTLSRADFD